VAERRDGLWINFHADLRHSVLHRSEEPVGVAEFLASYRRPKIEATWPARDPGPFLLLWSRTAGGVASAAWRGVRRP
jgi:hypothetical protein